MTHVPAFTQFPATVTVQLDYDPATGTWPAYTVVFDDHYQLRRLMDDMSNDGNAWVHLPNGDDTIVVRVRRIRQLTVHGDIDGGDA